MENRVDRVCNTVLRCTAPSEAVKKKAYVLDKSVSFYSYWLAAVTACLPLDRGSWLVGEKWQVNKLARSNGGKGRSGLK